jgi:hypothetical protein
MGFLCRGGDRARPFGGKPSPVQRIELKLEPLQTARDVDQKDRDQVA